MRVRDRPRQRAVLTAGGETRRRHRPDYMLVALSLVLLLIGLVVIYSISPGLAASRGVSDNYYTVKQLVAILIGLITFGFMAFVPLNYWHRVKRPLIVIAVVATIIALLTPVNAEYPAHRWIRFAGFSFQSVELVKFAVVFVLSAFLVDRLKKGQLNNFKQTLKPILIVMLLIGFVVAKLQSDLGSAAVIMAMIIAMTFVAGLSFKRVALVGLALLIGATIAIASTPYRRDRLVSFLNPETDCVAAGYQACQALIAIGSGGITGKGLGHSVQAYGYLPEAANDSIFAIYAEKFGFLGVALLLTLFMAFFSRIRHIMERAPDDYTRLMVAGLLAWLSTQTLINIGAMVGLLPMKGITLPFISYGGTSIIFTTAAIGLLFNISRFTTFTTRSDDEIRQERKGGAVRYAQYGARRG